jgi:hypothetical protein
VKRYFHFLKQKEKSLSQIKSLFLHEIRRKVLFSPSAFVFSPKGGIAKGKARRGRGIRRTMGGGRRK